MCFRCYVKRDDGVQQFLSLYNKECGNNLKLPCVHVFNPHTSEHILKLDSRTLTRDFRLNATNRLLLKHWLTVATCPAHINDTDIMKKFRIIAMDNKPGTPGFKLELSGFDYNAHLFHNYDGDQLEKAVDVAVHGRRSLVVYICDNSDLYEFFCRQYLMANANIVATNCVLYSEVCCRVCFVL